MNSINGFLNCSLVYETNSENGEVLFKNQIKKAEIYLGRREDGMLALNLRGGKVKNELMTLDSFSVHKNFMKEGKASIVFKNLKLFISNSPPEQLFSFLKLLYVKNETSKQNLPKVNKVLSRFKSFTEISPFNSKDLNLINKLKAIQFPGDKKNQTKRKCDVTPNGKENINPFEISSPLKSLKPKAKRHLQMKSESSSSSLITSSLPNSLTPEQVKVLQTVNQGKNIFITGSAGTGKSFLLTKIIESSPPDSTFVTASTGLAACHIKGTTIHCFAGIGSGDLPLEQSLSLASRLRFRNQWRQCRRLIIDEVSMLSGEMFDKLDAVARHVRQNKKSFGGIQLILCGDFLQLPPVTRAGQQKTFAFQSKAWSCCALKNFILKQVMRQEEASFALLLSNLRLGICSKEEERKLQMSKMNEGPSSGILPTKLSTHKHNVESINQHQLQLISDTPHIFKALDEPEGYLKTLDSLCPAPSILTLKIGAQVMIIKNINVSKGLANGSRGMVVGFKNGINGEPIIKLVSGKQHPISFEKWSVVGPGGIYLVRKQIPLQLAWALSIHKSQGMTLDAVEMNLSNVFEPGQAYVALSRAKNFQSLKVINFDKKCIRADENAIDFYNQLSIQDCC